MDEFRTELENLLNKHSMENGSNTPDFILAMFLTECLQAFDGALLARGAWYGRMDSPGQSATLVDGEGVVVTRVNQ